VVVCGQYRLAAVFAAANTRRLWSFLVIWICSVTIKCLKDHQLLRDLTILNGGHRVAFRRPGGADHAAARGPALDGTGARGATVLSFPVAPCSTTISNGRIWRGWMCLVTEKCPNDHEARIEVEPSPSGRLGNEALPRGWRW
jgi:hypothetical protein